MSEKQNYGLTIGGDYSDTDLCGEVKNSSGCVEPKFIKAMERLMQKYKVNYVLLFWSKFK